MAGHPLQGRDCPRYGYTVWTGDREVIESVILSYPPTDEPWKVREMHIRHPDGHVFRISKGIGQAE
jgi:hypothetical protein